MTINTFSFPYYEKLKEGKAIFYRFRVWVGFNYETSVFWKAKNNDCYHFESLIDNSDRQKPISKIIVDKKIKCNKFDKLIKKLLKQGILDFEIDNFHGYMRNYNDHYFILLEDGTFHCFMIMCGHHRDPRFEKILDIMKKYTGHY